MKNFMIGQYGKFDYDKFNRDYKKEFYGIEACLFKTEEEIENLIKEANNNNFSVGIHFPLRAGKSQLRDAQFLSPNEKIKYDAYRWVEDEIQFLHNIKPKYILFHYPKPVILDDNVDWRLWRFADKSEYIYESKYSYDKLKQNSEILFKWLSDKGFQYNFTPVLEFDALNKYIYKTELLENLLIKYNNIKLCLDTGRLHLQDKIDPNYNSKELIKRFAKYAEVIHLWNVRVCDNLEKNHFPALPSLKEEDGWAPIGEYIKIIKEENKNVKIMFEHRSEIISNEELEECYSWISKLLEE